MPTQTKFGKIWFNGCPFGANSLAPNNFKNSIHRVPLGFLVRRQIRKEIIFRVRSGNGSYGAIRGEVYQDKYRYFVPASINNVQGQPARNALKQAVLNWQTILTPSQKLAYNKAAVRKKGMTGYHKYVGEYIKANA